MTDVKTPIYRRELPDICISLNSTEGKRLFQESLSEGYAECFFKMVSQFRTQDEPAYCGLSTLVMVLNALEVDPGKTWKGIWKWYHESMLECCVPIDVIQKEGTTFDEILCIATCNHLDVKTAVRADETASINSFRDNVKEYSRRDDAFLALSYSRESLGQTGVGHFSPMGAYHPERDMILILDTARFKYPPYWISLPTLWEAMKVLDAVTNKPRGYIALSRMQDASVLSPLMGITSVFSAFRRCKYFDSVGNYLRNLSVHLKDDVSSVLKNNSVYQTDSSRKDIIVAVFVKHLLDMTVNFKENTCFKEFLFGKQDLLGNRKSYMIRVQAILKQLERLDIYRIVTDCLQCGMDSCFWQENSNSSSGEPSEKRARVDTVTCAHMITVIFLSFPYADEPKGSVGQYLGRYAKDMFAETRKHSPELEIELSVTHRNLQKLLSLYGREKHEGYERNLVQD